jgi:hypothetical protein
MNKELKKCIARYYDDMIAYSRSWESSVGRTVIRKNKVRYPVDLCSLATINSEYEYAVRSRLIEDKDPEIDIDVLDKGGLMDAARISGTAYYIKNKDDDMAIVLWSDAATSIRKSLIGDPDKVARPLGKGVILKMAAIPYSEIAEIGEDDDYWKVECESRFNSIAGLAASIMTSTFSTASNNATLPYLFCVNMPNGKSVAEEFCEKENMTADMIDALEDEHDYATNDNSTKSSYRYRDTFDVRRSKAIGESKYSIGMLSYIPAITLKVNKNNPTLIYENRLSDTWHYPTAMIDQAIVFGTAAYRWDALSEYPELRKKLTAVRPKIVKKYDDVYAKLKESTESVPMSFTVGYQNARSIVLSDVVMCNLQKGTIDGSMNSTKMLNLLSEMFGNDDVINVKCESYGCSSIFINVKALADERNEISIVADQHKYGRYGSTSKAIQVKRGRLKSIYDVGVIQILDALERYRPEDALRLKLEYAVM